MDYQKHTVEDFVLDANFRKWVLNPDKESNLFWEGWISQYPEKVSLLKEAKKLLLHLPEVKHDLDEGEINMLWNAIDLQILEKPESLSVERKVVPLHSKAILEKNASIPPKPKYDHQFIGKIAASIIVIFCIGLAFFMAQRFEETPTVEPVLVMKETSWGQRSTIFLSDGTEVILNAGSSIEYFKDFSDKERIIKLKGEAFFKVAKEKDRPFKVLSGNVVTQALGTSFNVTAYKGDEVSVALVTGKVVLDNVKNTEKPQSLVLNPGEKAQYEANSGFSKGEFDTNRVLSWKDGILYFQNADEEEVIKTLERWYGVKFITYGVSSKEWDYNASFKNQSLEQILMSLSHSMEFDFKINQKVIEITYK